MKAPRRAPALAHLRFAERAEQLAGLPLEALFREIWSSNLWGADTSVSGLGSEDAATAPLRAALPALFANLGIRSLIDAPCGDFGWMRDVVDGIVRYTGIDIVPELVARNQRAYGTSDGRIGFRHANLISDPLPRADAILCRDCMVHLSFANIAAALANIRASGATWLIATTFTRCTVNSDIADGDWRILNLTLPPIALPPPAYVIDEQCEEADGSYRDKALGVWRIGDWPTRP